MSHRVARASGAGSPGTRASIASTASAAAAAPGAGRIIVSTRRAATGSFVGTASGQLASHALASG